MATSKVDGTGKKVSLQFECRWLQQLHPVAWPDLTLYVFMIIYSNSE
jgi:hypothetical protein